MEATIETVLGVPLITEIDTNASPIGIIRKFYEEDAIAASQIFPNQKTIDQFMEGNADEVKSTFELINLEGNGVRAKWKEPLCNQPIIMKELSKIKSEGQFPTFVVSVGCTASI